MKNIIHLFCLLFYSLCMLLYLFYSLIVTGDSNHTGFNILGIFLFCFIIALAFSVFLRILSKNANDKKIINFHFIVLGLFLFIVISFDIFNVMVYYGKWIERGMPEKYKFKIERRIIIE